MPLSGASVSIKLLCLCRQSPWRSSNTQPSKPLRHHGQHHQQRPRSIEQHERSCTRSILLDDQGVCSPATSAQAEEGALGQEDVYILAEKGAVPKTVLWGKASISPGETAEGKVKFSLSASASSHTGARAQKVSISPSAPWPSSLAPSRVAAETQKTNIRFKSNRLASCVEGEGGSE